MGQYILIAYLSEIVSLSIPDMSVASYLNFLIAFTLYICMNITKIKRLFYSFAHHSLKHSPEMQKSPKLPNTHHSVTYPRLHKSMDQLEETITQSERAPMKTVLKILMKSLRILLAKQRKQMINLMALL